MYMEVKSLQNDLRFGAENEVIILDKLKTHFDMDMEKTEPYCVYDAENQENKIRYEVKARRCQFSTYPTTIIPVHKTKARKKGLKLIFVKNTVHSCPKYLK